MINMNRSRMPRQFEVTIGYSRVTVAGETREDAIRKARLALSQEMPRLYDLIHDVDDGCFHVAPLTEIEPA